VDESQLSDLARTSAVMRRTVALAEWLADSGPRAVTAREVLRKPDVPAAAAAIGTTLPKTFRSASDVPQLHRAWLLAQAAGLVVVTGGKAAADLVSLADADDAVLSSWVEVLVASAAVEYGQRSMSTDMLVSFLMIVAENPADPRVRSWAKRSPAFWDLLEDFGAVTGQPQLTPLGAWAMERLQDRMPCMPEGLTAAEMLARLTTFDDYERRSLTWQWMEGRDPEQAVREILAAAISMSPRMRWLAADNAEVAGEDALAAWRDALNEPLLAVHARCALIAWEDAPPLTAAEQLWLAVEAAAAGLEERGPDEALCRLWEGVPGSDVDDRLAMIQSVDHPSTAEVIRAVTDLIASGAPLTIRQAMRLKVQLKYVRTPIWRSVVVPSMCSLGDLHQVIQVLFGWDGDHLHEFRVDDRQYSDPSYGLEEAGEEEDVRIRDIFRSKVQVKVGYEYDFGAGWEHEITLQKVLPLDAATPYPVCVSFEGESPEEYPAGDLDGRRRKREPYSLTAVNAALAGLGDSAYPPS
jgi:Plasmid pRiA4b ORF-3-like protein